MALIRTTGNLITMAENGDFEIIIHGCNCQNTMGSGVAKEMRARYPGVYDADTLFSFDKQPVEKLGCYSSYAAMGSASQFLIVNAYTQLDYLPRGVDHFEYHSFVLILKKLVTLYPGKRFGFPHIGMQLAGGNPKVIIPMLELFAEEVEATGGMVTMVEFDGSK